MMVLTLLVAIGATVGLAHAGAKRDWASMVFYCGLLLMMVSFDLNPLRGVFGGLAMMVGGFTMRRPSSLEKLEDDR